VSAHACKTLAHTCKPLAHTFNPPAHTCKLHANPLRLLVFVLGGAGMRTVVQPVERTPQGAGGRVFADASADGAEQGTGESPAR
jgi:hypothetical protein